MLEKDRTGLLIDKLTQLVIIQNLNNHSAISNAETAACLACAVDVKLRVEDVI
jgi:hypothetical protein